MKTQPVLECRSLGRDLFGRTVLHDLTFALEPQSCLAIVGPNGAGKTTLIRVCLGVLRASRGTARLWGLDPRSEGPRVRARCGVVLEEAPFYPGLSGLENLVVWGELFGMSRAEAANAAWVEADRFGMSGCLEEAAGGLSAGQRRRLALARAFMTDPDLLVLDEPTAGLDFHSRRGLRERIERHLGLRCGSVLIASHETHEIERVATHLLVLESGRIRAFGSTQEVLQGRVLESVIAETLGTR